MKETQKPKYFLQIKIMGLPRTVNSIGRAHWTIKSKEARLWRSAVVYAVGKFRPAKPLKYAEVEFVRGSPTQLDHDNLAGSFKHVQDGLIDAGVIENDKYDNIGSPSFIWEKAPAKKGYITVTVLERSEPWGMARHRLKKPSELSDESPEAVAQRNDSSFREPSSRPPSRARGFLVRAFRNGLQAPGASGKIHRGRRKARADSHGLRRLRPTPTRSGR